MSHISAQVEVEKFCWESCILPYLRDIFIVIKLRSSEFPQGFAAQGSWAAILALRKGRPAVAQ